jgi:uncharacterized protein with von Willebrand factor type A (vWA) domain
MTLPRPLLPFHLFVRALRAARFAIAPEQIESFIAATLLLGPRSLGDIHRAARATLAPPPERHDEFDALFRQAFLGQTIAAPSLEQAEDEETVIAWDSGDPGFLPPEGEEEPSGAEATTAERLAGRAFAEASGNLAAFRRALPEALPKRRSRRTRPSRQGRAPDPRRILRKSLSHDGEIVRLPRRARRVRLRPILLLVDISGSMKRETKSHLRIAHALLQAADRVEVFTLGTRLTRVTRALRLRDPDQALTAAGHLVADWDGGTRLGEALQTFLALPRFAGAANGAVAVILSDGLERGSPDALLDALGRLRRRARIILWLTPLMRDPAFRPETGALSRILPFLDRLGDGSSVEAVCREVLLLDRRLVA